MIFPNATGSKVFENLRKKGTLITHIQKPGENVRRDSQNTL